MIRSWYVFHSLATISCKEAYIFVFHFQHGFIFAGGSFDEFRPSPQEDVATIMDMGFGEDVAKEALVLSHNDVERAIHLLLS